MLEQISSLIEKFQHFDHLTLKWVEFVEILASACEPNKSIVSRIVTEAIQNSSSKFYLYGAGSHTQWILSHLRNVGELEKIVGVVDKSAITPYYNNVLEIVVNPLKPFRLKPGEKIIIAHQKWESDMIDDCMQIGIPRDRIHTVYTSEEYMELIAAKIFSFQSLLCDIPIEIRTKKTSKRVVVVNGFNANLLISYACQNLLSQELGWEFVRVNLHALKDAQAQEKVHVLECNGQHDRLLKYVSLLSPDVILAEDHLDNCQITTILLRIAFHKIPIISTYYDLIHIHREYDKNRKLEFASEKFAIENSEGILHRTSVEAIQYLNDQYDIYSKNHICFQPYASKTTFPEIIIKNKTYPFKLVSAHTIYDTASSKKHKTFESDVVGLYENVLKQGIEVDIFIKGAVGETLKANYSDYLALEQDFPNFKVYNGLAQHEIIEILPVKYDFALNLFVDYENHPAGRQALGMFEFSGRYFFYIAMGLPIITTTFLQQSAAFVRDNGLGIVIHSNQLDQLKKILKQTNHQSLLKNIAQFRDSIALESQIASLGSYFRNICK